MQERKLRSHPRAGKHTPPTPKRTPLSRRVGKQPSGRPLGLLSFWSPSPSWTARKLLWKRSQAWRPRGGAPPLPSTCPSPGSSFTLMWQRWPQRGRATSYHWSHPLTPTGPGGEEEQGRGLSAFPGGSSALWAPSHCGKRPGHLLLRFDLFAVGLGVMEGARRPTLLTPWTDRRSSKPPVVKTPHVREGWGPRYPGVIQNTLSQDTGRFPQSARYF